MHWLHASAQLTRVYEVKKEHSLSYPSSYGTWSFAKYCLSQAGSSPYHSLTRSIPKMMWNSLFKRFPQPSCPQKTLESSVFNQTTSPLEALNRITSASIPTWDSPSHAIMALSHLSAGRLTASANRHVGESACYFIGWCCSTWLMKICIIGWWIIDGFNLLDYF